METLLCCKSAGDSLCAIGSCCCCLVAQLFLLLLCCYRSKNKLELKMNTSDEHATADVTVFDVFRRFRLVVMEVGNINNTEPVFVH